MKPADNLKGRNSDSGENDIFPPRYIILRGERELSIFLEFAILFFWNIKETNKVIISLFQMMETLRYH